MPCFETNNSHKPYTASTDSYKNNSNLEDNFARDQATQAACNRK
jgi:hypothetical protein